MVDHILEISRLIVLVLKTLTMILQNYAYEINPHGTRQCRSLHLIPMFIRTHCMKYLSMILLLKIFVYLTPAPVAGGLELLRTPLINQRRCQVVYILFQLTPAVQYSTVQYNTVQYSTIQYSTIHYK